MFIERNRTSSSQFLIDKNKQQISNMEIPLPLVGAEGDTHRFNTSKYTHLHSVPSQTPQANNQQDRYSIMKKNFLLGEKITGQNLLLCPHKLIKKKSVGPNA